MGRVMCEIVLDMIRSFFTGIPGSGRLLSFIEGVPLDLGVFTDDDVVSLASSSNVAPYLPPSSWIVAGNLAVKI